MRELAFLNKGLSIILVDKTAKKEKEYKNKYDGGIQEFVEFLDAKKTALVNKNDVNLFKKPIYISGTKDNVDCRMFIESGMLDILKRCCHLQIIFIKEMEERIY